MYQKFGFLWKIFYIFPFCFVSIAHAEEQAHPKDNGQETDFCDVKQYPESMETKLIQYIQNASAAGISSHEFIENVLKDYPSFRDFFEKQRNEDLSDEGIVGVFKIGLVTQFLAEGGCLWAQTFLAAMANITGDYQEALKWYRMAAEQGDAPAQYELGAMYSSGRGLPQDDREALKWYRLAAEQGIAEAQYNLGVMYYNGQGVPQSYEEAAKWYRFAAEQGIAEAQNNLGVMYFRGQGVAQDYQEAVKWWRLVAEQGVAEAQHNLGARYTAGQGVPQDYVQAHMWFNLAAANGNKQAAESRETLAGLMTPEQISKAQQLAKEWMEKHNESAKQGE